MFLSFRITGYGCKECIQNEESNGLKVNVKDIVNEVSIIKLNEHNFHYKFSFKNNLITVCMVSGSRQTQQRNSLTKANYVTSPPLVLAYALAGNVLVDFEQEYIGVGDKKVPIKNIWPSRQYVEEIEDEVIIKSILNQFNEKIAVNFTRVYFHIF